MKPSESLVHSRYKECFDLQIRKEWKNFIVQICKNQKLASKINRFSDVLTPIHFKMESNKNLLFLVQPEW